MNRNLFLLIFFCFQLITVVPKITALHVAGGTHEMMLFSGCYYWIVTKGDKELILCQSSSGLHFSCDKTTYSFDLLLVEDGKMHLTLKKQQLEAKVSSHSSFFKIADNNQLAIVSEEKLTGTVPIIDATALNSCEFCKQHVKSMPLDGNKDYPGSKKNEKHTFFQSCYLTLYQTIYVLYKMLIFASVCVIVISTMVHFDFI
jgi:hypothetical protein